MERLKQRGIIRDEQAKKMEARNAPKSAKSVTDKPSDDVPKDKVQNSKSASVNVNSSVRDASSKDKEAANDEGIKRSKRPLDKIRPTIRKQDYIEYDFATMKNSHGGFINIEEDYEGPDNKKQQSLEDWQRSQRERRALYENAPPPDHPSLAPKCTECNINTELDPLLLDTFHLQVCKSCVKAHPEKYSLLTKTECKEDYFLTDPELNDDSLFYRLEKPNPHSGTFARMQLFARCQIEEFAFKKWGGEEGLDKEWQRREEGKAERREKKYQQKMKEMRIKTRAQEYTKRLLQKKHGEEHIHEFSNAVDGGVNDDGLQVLKRRCIGCGLETEEIAI